MSYQLFLGFTFEGSTDERFFNSIIERTLSDIIFKYSTIDVEIILIPLKKSGNTFIEQSMNAIKLGQNENSVDIFFIHCDADDVNNENVIQYKFEPLYKAIEDSDEVNNCIIIPIIPIQMTEAWLIADFELFANEISTNKTKSELQISGNPEDFSNPKLKIIESLRIVNMELPKKRRKDLQISELYQIIGQKIDINNLRKLKSFQEFYNKSFTILKELKIINYTENLQP